MKFNISTTNQNKLVMGFLVTCFFVYNAFLYFPSHSSTEVHLSQSALNGAMLYQENNCTSCHQFYGLGGYLGPDLTNAISTGENAEQRIKTFINLGYKSMPKFNFSEEELDNLIQFLKEVDQTGYYPNCAEEVMANGWVKIKTKRNDETK